MVLINSLVSVVYASKEYVQLFLLAIENFLLVVLVFQMVLDSLSVAKLTTIPAPLVDPVY